MGRGQCGGQRGVRAQADRAVELVEVDGVEPERASDARREASSARRTSSFQGDGMNLVATTAPGGTVGVGGQERPDDPLALAPP